MKKIKKILLILILISILIFFWSKILPKSNEFGEVDTRIIAKEFSRNNLSQMSDLLGDRSFTQEEFDFGGQEIESLVVYPNTGLEKRLIEKDGKKLILINNNKDSINGIRVGDPLETIVDKNNSDFYFYGFEWDGSGSLVSWNKGQFNEEIFSIKLMINSKYDNYVIENLLGDDVLFSGDIDLEKVDIVVESISISV